MQIEFTKEFVDSLAIELADLVQTEQDKNQLVHNFVHGNVPVAVRWTLADHGMWKTLSITVILDRELEILHMPISAYASLEDGKTKLVEDIVKGIRVFLSFVTQSNVEEKLKTLFVGIMEDPKNAHTLDAAFSPELTLKGSVCPDLLNLNLTLFKKDRVLCQFNEVPLYDVVNSFNYNVGSMPVAKVFEMIKETIKYQFTLSDSTLTVDNVRSFTSGQTYRAFLNAIHRSPRADLINYPYQPMM